MPLMLIYAVFSHQPLNLSKGVNLYIYETERRTGGVARAHAFHPVFLKAGLC